MIIYTEKNRGKTVNDLSLLHDLKLLCHTEDPDSIFYIEPTIHNIYNRALEVINRYNIKPAPGFLTRSTYRADLLLDEMKIEIYKCMHVKTDVLMCCFEKQ